jgi:hypothetical protein
MRLQYDGIQVWSQISNLVYKGSPLPASRCLPTWFSHTSKAGEDVTSPYFSGFSPTPGPFQCQVISQGRQPLLRIHVAHLKPINQLGYEPPKTVLPEAAAIKGRKPSLKRPKNMVVACHLRYSIHFPEQIVQWSNDRSRSSWLRGLCSPTGFGHGIWDTGDPKWAYKPPLT